MSAETHNDHRRDEKRQRSIAESTLRGSHAREILEAQAAILRADGANVGIRQAWLNSVNFKLRKELTLYWEVVKTDGSYSNRRVWVAGHSDDHVSVGFSDWTRAQDFSDYEKIGREEHKRTFHPSDGLERETTDDEKAMADQRLAAIEHKAALIKDFLSQSRSLKEKVAFAVGLAKPSQDIYHMNVRDRMGRSLDDGLGKAYISTVGCGLLIGGAGALVAWPVVKSIAKAREVINRRRNS